MRRSMLSGAVFLACGILVFSRPLSIRQEHLDSLQAKARVRLRDEGQMAFIRKQCKSVAAKLRKRGTAILSDTPGSRKNQWTSSLIGEIADAHPPRQPPPWAEAREEYMEQLNGYKTLQRQEKRLVEKHFFEKWRLSWESYQRKHDRNPTAAQMASLLKKNRLDLHGNLAKAESSLAVQIRTEKIGFAQFLHRQRVPAVTSPVCDCGWHSQTAEHIVRYCSLRPHRQRMLEEAGTMDYRKIVSTPKGVENRGLG